MQFKNKCDEFLQSVTAMRENAIAETVRRELELKHEPYKAQMAKQRDDAVNAHNQEFNQIIEQLKKEHEAKVQSCIAYYNTAVAEHHTNVTNAAKNKAKEEYDKFILQMSALVDNTKID
jgi:DNA relaxase NicK